MSFLVSQETLIIFLLTTSSENNLNKCKNILFSK